MEVRVWSRGRLLLGAIAVAAAVLAPASAAAKKPPHGGGGSGGGFSTTSTYVKNYANVVSGVEVGLTPEGVQAAPDGGWTALALTETSNGAGVSWLLKASPLGAPQWQEELGCLSGAPGDYADALSLERTSDGGYVLAGGTVGCGSGNNCPELTGLQCGLIERIDSTGVLVWAHVYSAGVDGTALRAIRPTSDGGLIAVGSASDASQRPGALIVKLDGSGNVQWQRELGPSATSYAEFDAVAPTSDGGYVAAGVLNDGSTSASGEPLMTVLTAKFDGGGSLVWERGFNDVGASGVTATEHVNAVVQTADGGYAVGGDWNSSTGPGTCCQGALLLKLSAVGAIDWQQAYSGGVYCYFNGFNETCTNLGGGVYSVGQTADGGYLLAGDSNLKLLDSTPLVPWLAKVDSSGGIVWQEQDYQANATTTRPLSEYFASSALSSVGPFAIGSTENYSNGLNELLGVQTDANGNVAACSQIHSGSPLGAVNPGLVAVAPEVTVQAITAAQSAAPVQTLPTAATATAAQC